MITYSSLMPNAAAVVTSTAKNRGGEPGRSRHELTSDDSGRAQLDVRSVNHVARVLKRENAIVGMLVDSALPENELQAARPQPAPRNISLSPEKVRTRRRADRRR